MTSGSVDHPRPRILQLSRPGAEEGTGESQRLNTMSHVSNSTVNNAIKIGRPLVTALSHMFGSDHN
jgi:hypothetical protein